MDQAEVELVEAVRTLARTGFAERATRYDHEGAFVAEDIAELVALRVPAIAFPKGAGGLGMSAEAQVRVIEEVAYGDGSAAVALNMHLFAAELLSALPPFPRLTAVLQDMARDSTMICGPVSIPTGELDNRTTGLRLTDAGDAWLFDGRVGFASMSEGAKYVMAVGTVAHEGQEPDIALAIPDLATPGIDVLGNWDAMGLRGTASHDIRFTAVRIPKAETMVVPAVMLRMVVQAAATNPALVTARARGPLGICAIWLGLAQAARDFTVDYLGKRHGAMAGDSSLLGTPVLRATEAWAQSGLGELEFWLDSGRVRLHEMVRRLDQPFATTQEFNRAIVGTIYHLRRMSEEVSAGAMRVCGAHAYVRGSRLERIFRDMVGANVMAWKTDQLRQVLGQGALGLPISIGGPSPI